MSITFATTLLMTQLGLSGATAPPVAEVDLDAVEACHSSLDVRTFPSPRRPHQHAPFRILTVSDLDLGVARVFARTPDGEQVEIPSVPYGGPPWGWVAEVAEPAVGRWRVALVNHEGVQACRDILVGRARSGSNALEEGEPVWRSRIKWERDTENLYSLWIEHLFHVPLDQDVSWNPLHELLRDPERNLLHDYLGLDEDRAGRGAMVYDPDCADFPYYLRAYFGWKLGLPFAYRPCRRGTATRAPTCGDFVTNEVEAEGETRLAAFQRYIRRVKGVVHSSSLRGLPEDEASDFYPVRLDRKALRPGTIYTDPYGHTMMVARWYPPTEDQPGVLMTADAQPDGVVGRRIFWRGNFMFPDDDALKGAGWKRFRPVVRTRDGHAVMSNAEIAASVDYGDFSVEQWELGKDGFYERMDELINPDPAPPERAMLATIDALDQQVRRRVESVANGEEWKRQRRGEVMRMPDGASIFLTSGPWEDLSTPSRDMRLLIAMDTVKATPERVRRYPHRFILPPGASVDAAVEEVRERLREETSRRTITYQRSDGTPWTLTLADVLDRAEAFEMAYNPNDCVEVRWGAPEGSEERAPCTRRAPKDQLEKMASYRPWFQKRERPSR